MLVLVLVGVNCDVARAGHVPFRPHRYGLGAVFAPRIAAMLFHRVMQGLNTVAAADTGMLVVRDDYVPFGVTGPGVAAAAAVALAAAAAAADVPVASAAAVSVVAAVTAAAAAAVAVAVVVGGGVVVAVVVAAVVGLVSVGVVVVAVVAVDEGGSSVLVAFDLRENLNYSRRHSGAMVLQWYHSHSGQSGPAAADRLSRLFPPASSDIDGRLLHSGSSSSSLEEYAAADPCGGIGRRSPLGCLRVFSSPLHISLCTASGNNGVVQNAHPTNVMPKRLPLFSSADPSLSLLPPAAFPTNISVAIRSDSSDPSPNP